MGGVCVCVFDVYGVDVLDMDGVVVSRPGGGLGDWGSGGWGEWGDWGECVCGGGEWGCREGSGGVGGEGRGECVCGGDWGCVWRGITLKQCHKETEAMPQWEHCTLHTPHMGSMDQPSPRHAHDALST